SSRQLPEPRVRRVHIQTLSVLRDHFPALQIRFVRIVTRHQRLEVRIPIAQVISPALLNPALEVARGDLVRKVETRMRRFQNRDRRQFVSHSKGTRLRSGKGRKLAADKLSLRISKDHKLATRVIKKLRVVLREPSTRITVCANHDHIKL